MPRKKRYELGSEGSPRPASDLVSPIKRSEVSTRRLLRIRNRSYILDQSPGHKRTPPKRRRTSTSDSRTRRAIDFSAAEVRLGSSSNSVETFGVNSGASSIAKTERGKVQKKRKRGIQYPLGAVTDRTRTRCVLSTSKELSIPASARSKWVLVSEEAKSLLFDSISHSSRYVHT